MRRVTTAWDQWFLMRCPLLWQLRLHWYVPLALLWCLLMFGGWIGWMAEPARWMGSVDGMPVNPWNPPEEKTREAGSVVAWIIAFGVTLWWLWRVRIHNRWRELAPAGRWSLWWEYLCGAVFLSLLLAPTLLLGTAYRHRVQHAWQGQDTAAALQAARHVSHWEVLLAPGNAARLVEWSAAVQADADSDSTTCDENEEDRALCSADPLQSLRWLAQGDTAAVAAQLQHYGAALGRWGYAPARPTLQGQAQQLIGAYRAALQSPLAQEWRAYKAQHTAAPQPQQQLQRPPGRARDAHDCDNALPGDPQACFAAAVGRSTARWRDNLLSALQQRLHQTPQWVPWVHPRYGMAQPGLVAHHLKGALPFTAHQRQQHNGSLLAAASAGFFVGLALIAARLLSLRQIVGVCTALTLAAPALMLAGMIGLPDHAALPLVPTGLLALAWVRIAWLRRPWGGSVLLGVGLALSLAGWASLWSQAEHLLQLAPDSWPSLLMGGPAVAASTALLVVALSPLWRRWRALPER